MDGGLTGKIESELKLLRRHLRILKEVEEQGPVGIIQLSNDTGYPQHKVRYSLRVLEQEGLIEPSTQGARTTDGLREFTGRLKHLLDLMAETTDALRTTIDGRS